MVHGVPSTQRTANRGAAISTVAQNMALADSLACVTGAVDLCFLSLSFAICEVELRQA